MRVDLFRDECEIPRDELPPQRRVIATLAVQPFDRRGDARRMVANDQRHHVGRHRFAVQAQWFGVYFDAAQVRIARQPIDAERNAQAQPLTCRISPAQESITGSTLSAFSESRLNTTRETPRSR